MTDNLTIWKAMQDNLPKRTWIPLADIFAMVRTSIVLDAEDLARLSVSARTPCWKSNVRILLHTKQETGSVMARKHGGEE
ncbi:MAG: hypothetical protein WB699_02765 [Bacteroidota bacterium]